MDLTGAPTAPPRRILALIEQLPWAVLAMICTQATISASDQDIIGRTPLTYSHVNSYLHRMTLSIPQLWTFIDYRLHPSLNQLFLERSASQPLHLTIETNPSLQKLVQFNALIEEHIHRVRCLRVLPSPSCRERGGQTVDAPILELVNRVTSLESLTLSFPWREIDTPPELDAQRTSILEPLRHPHLKHLRLEYFVRLPTSITTPTMLTQLTLLRHTISAESLFDFLGFLTFTPALEVLRIECCGQGEAWRRFPDIPCYPVNLPRLRYLSITTSPVKILQELLRALRTPSGVIVRCHVRDGTALDLEHLALFPHPTEADTWESFEFFRKPTTLRIHQSKDEDGDILLKAGNAGSTYSLRLSKVKALATLLRTLPSILHMASIRELWLGPILARPQDARSWRRGWPEESWRTLFLTLPALELLALPRGGYTAILDSLRPSPGETEALLPCPRLSTVHVFPSVSSFDESLRRFLQTRAELDHPIQHLHCHIYPPRWWYGEWTPVVDLRWLHAKPSEWWEKAPVSRLGGDGWDSNARYPHCSDVTGDDVGEEIMDKVGEISAVQSRLAAWERWENEQ